MISESNLLVSQEMTAEVLEEAFHRLFPYLKLEVIKRGELLVGSSLKTQLKKIGNKRKPSGFVITPEMSVSQLELAFWEHMGIQVSIFRKFGSSMLETSFTSAWSLERQNIKGSEFINDF